MSDLSKYVKGLGDFMKKECPDSAPVEMSGDMQTATRWLPLSYDMAEIFGMEELPFGQLIHIFGKKNTGKSTILMQLMKVAQDNGVLPVLLLTEHKFDWERFTGIFKGDSKAVQLLEPEFLQSVFEAADKVLDKVKSVKDHPPVWLFWDSIGATDLKDLEVGDWDKDAGRTAQAVKKLMKRLHRRVHRDPILKDKVGFTFLNQAWDKRTPSGMAILTPNGGESTQHYYSIELSLKRTGSEHGTVNKKKSKIAEKVKIEVIKNHITGHEPVSDVFACGGGIAIDKEDLKEKVQKFRSFARKKIKSVESVESVESVAKIEKEDGEE